MLAKVGRLCFVYPNEYDRIGLWQSMLDFVIADLESAP